MYWVIYFNLSVFIFPGGIFSGPGVTSATNTFSPATANPGLNTITYTYTNPFGCVTSYSASSTVHQLQYPNVVIAGLANGYCQLDSNAIFGVSPEGKECRYNLSHVQLELVQQPL